MLVKKSKFLQKLVVFLLLRMNKKLIKSNMLMKVKPLLVMPQVNMKTTGLSEEMLLVA